MRKNGKLLVTAVLVYLLLLVLLVAAEANAQGSSIHNIWDAIWFSLITMTTVGYGDLSPVTAAGRILGLIFALCSIGLLSVLIGVGLRLLNSRILPMLRLRLSRRQPWYVFTEENPDTTALANQLRLHDDSAVLIFPPREKQMLRSVGTVQLDADLESLIRLRGTEKGISLFCLGADSWENYSRGLKAAEQQLPAYCMTEAAAEDLPPEMHLFSRQEALSRCYWKEHPLQPEEQCVVLVGCGEAGEALLERALLTNVFEPGRRTEYHIFGEFGGFSARHPEIVRALSGGNPEEDSLLLYEEAWEDARAVVEQADRIIFCADEDEENLRNHETLRRWFATGAKLHLRLSEPVAGIASFGERERILTPEFVMKDEINRRAILLNEIYNRNSSQPTAWQELSPFLRQSNIAAADHLMIKVRFLLDRSDLTELGEEDCKRAYEKFCQRYTETPDLFQEIEHRRWMRFYQMYNWRFSPHRNDTQRLHPMLRPYWELSEAERKKDAYAWELLASLYAE